MPSAVVKSFAKQTGKSVKDVEKLWDKAKKEASKMGRKDDYAYITGILKNMLGINESYSDDYKKISHAFIQSNFTNFKEFEIESEDDGTISTDLKVKPEGSPKVKKKDKDCKKKEEDK